MDNKPLELIEEFWRELTILLLNIPFVDQFIKQIEAHWKTCKKYENKQICKNAKYLNTFSKHWNILTKLPYIPYIYH